MGIAGALGGAVLLASACETPPPVAAPAASPPLQIVEPPPGKVLSESYPPPANPSDPVQRAVLSEINRERAGASLPHVAWDASAARVAEIVCTRQVAEKTRGHYLRDGLPPYARTGLAGVFGYQSENSASWSTTASSFPDTPLELALGAQKSMMEETPPNDGHRRAILDPEATHVGVGWAMTGGRFQIAEEFLARGLERLKVRTEENPAVVRISGAPRAPLRLSFVTIAREPTPAPLTQAEANAHTSYKYPTARESYVPEGHISLRVEGTVTDDRIQVGRDGNFSFSYAPQRAGLFTFVFWLIKSGEDQPRPGGSAVVRVEG